MKVVRTLFSVGYVTITLLFAGCGVALIVFAMGELWHGINPTAQAAWAERLDAVLESIGVLTIAVAAFELGQTVLEEEVLREAHTSGPTRARRFLSRFLIVIVVALGIETLVAAFQFVHADPQHLVYAAMIGFAAAALLIGWGVFIRLNARAELLEPEAMERAKREDAEVG